MFVIWMNVVHGPISHTWNNQNLASIVAVAVAAAVAVIVTAAIHVATK